MADKGGCKEVCTGKSKNIRARVCRDESGKITSFEKLGDCRLKK